MRRVFLTVGLLGILTATAVGVAQPPVPLPASDPMTPAPRTLSPAVTGVQPQPGPNIPAGGLAVAPRGVDTPLSRFDPIAAYPMTTQLAVRSVLLGSGWMTRMNQAQGRFIYGYVPALHQQVEGDHDLKQAVAALALAQAARFSGDERQSAIAGQSVLALLAGTRIDPADGNCRVPVRASASCNRVGFAAVLVLAICELPVADERLATEADRLCEFVRKQLRPDGSVHYTDGPTDSPPQVDPAGVNEYPALSLQALAVSNRLRPAPWKLDAVRKGVEYYRNWFKAHPHPMLAATLTPAVAELYLQTKSPEAAAVVFELNDWLTNLQYRPDPRHPTWAGGFRGWANGQPVEVAPGFECGAYLQSLSWAYLVNRHVPDLGREARYRQATNDAAQFVTGLQYLETNTRHFADGFRANVLIGGFYLSPTDGNLRIDATGVAVTGLLRFLSCGAER